jgi:hypothetical protein
LKEEESGTREQPLHPPAPKVKTSLRDFTLRKNKQRMTKNVQDTPSSAGVDLPLGRECRGGPNGIQVNPLGQVDEEFNGKTVELSEDLVKEPTTIMASTTHSHHHRHLLPYQPFS